MADKKVSPEEYAHLSAEEDFNMLFGEDLTIRGISEQYEKALIEAKAPYLKTPKGVLRIGVEKKNGRDWGVLYTIDPKKGNEVKVKEVGPLFEYLATLTNYLLSTKNIDPKYKEKTLENIGKMYKEIEEAVKKAPKHAS